MTTLAEFAGKSRTAGRLLPVATNTGLRRAGLQGKQIADRTGGRMRNAGRKGADLRARVKVGNQVVFLRPVPKGLWTIAESGAGPHWIARRGTGGRGKRIVKASGVTVRRGKRRVLKLPDGGFREQVRHPGAKGRRAWTKAQERIARDAPARVAAAIASDCLGRVFR